MSGRTPPRRNCNEVEFDLDFDTNPMDFLPDEIQINMSNGRWSWCFFLTNILIIAVFITQLIMWNQTSQFTSEQMKSLQEIEKLIDDNKTIHNVNNTNVTSLKRNNSMVNVTKCKLPSPSPKNKAPPKNLHFAEASQFNIDKYNVDNIKKSCCEQCNEEDQSSSLQLEGEVKIKNRHAGHGMNKEELISINRKIVELQLEIASLREALENTSQWKGNIEEKIQETQTIANCTSLINDTSVKEQIAEAIMKYDADKNGKTDFALESAGGSICSTPNTIPYPSKATYEVFGLLTLHYPSNPRTLIQPGILPGECFAFHGSRGRIRIKLSQKINITEVGLEHTTLSFDNSTMPNTFSVYGADDDFQEAIYVLGHFKYEQGGPSLQTYEISGEKSVKLFEYVELSITSNYGHPHYTCIYRFRVHGFPTDELDKYIY